MFELTVEEKQALIRFAQKGNLEEVIRLTKDAPEGSLDFYALNESLHCKYEDTALYLLPLTEISDQSQGNFLLKVAVNNNLVDVTKKMTDYKKTNDYLLGSAVSGENEKMIDTILPLVHSESELQSAFLFAVDAGHEDTVKKMLPFVKDNLQKDVYPLAIAAEKNNKKIFDLLLPFSDPSMMEGLALRRALLTASHEILQPLFDLSDPYEARQVIAETSYPNTAPSLAKLDEYIRRYEEKKELELATKDLKDDALRNAYKPKKI